SARLAAGANGATGARVSSAPELAYLAGAQNADGGFGPAAGQPSSELYTAWAAIGLAAAGRRPLSLLREGHTLLDALRAEAGSLHGAGDIERTMLALRASGVPAGTLPGAAGGADLEGRLLASRSSDGSFAHLTNITAFAVLALRAAGRPQHDPVVRAAARWLARQRNTDGGYGYGPRGGPSDIDDTGAVLQALRAAGTRPAALGASVRYLRGSQRPDGGFPQQRGGASNAQSTAWAIQGLVAAGRIASRVTRAGSRSPVAYLRTLLTPGGSVRYSATGAQTPVWVTAQALTGLTERPLPVAPP
ncbi:MAG TPA: prenyltransferase/squalene oxidase repeat-containing protein, partial [Solirubrobacteraceae bacterium]|nr:prenyltransferase/squalene oxidase repeat-containing protein [Solirubrobacteraceae bacterium]